MAKSRRSGKSVKKAEEVAMDAGEEVDFQEYSKMDELFKMGFISIEEVDALTPDMVQAVDPNGELGKKMTLKEKKRLRKQFANEESSIEHKEEKEGKKEEMHAIEGEAVTVPVKRAKSTSAWAVTESKEIKTDSVQPIVNNNNNNQNNKKNKVVENVKEIKKVEKIEKKKEEVKQINQEATKNKKKEAATVKKTEAVKKEEIKKEAVTTISIPRLSPEELLAWRDFDLDEKILAAIKDAGFTEPMPVQKSTLEALKSGKKDVLGSAPTGSGKTLAFGLPILNFLARRINGNEGLTGLILVPTRELAIQIESHLRMMCKYLTGVKIATVVGGLSAEKQSRLLSRQPDILIATPGRLQELTSLEVEIKSMLRGVRFLVIDEADRMVERGHFKELDDLLPIVFAPRQDDIDGNDGNGGACRRRQVFLFSATLNFDSQAMSGGKGGRASKRSPLQILCQKVKFNDAQPAIISSAKPLSGPESLKQFKFQCLKEEKDAYLFYCLQELRSDSERGKFGRVLVFVNAIDSIRRLVPLLQMLRIPAIGLHAQMQQRQRLKNLDRFRVADELVLVASDVASRGLDIKGVDHVIHYHLPNDAGIYLHRCGRTARANHSGTSVALIAPEEHNLLIKFNLKNLKDYPIDLQCLQRRVRPIMTAARTLENLEHQERAAAKNLSWAAKAAEDLGVDLDDDNDPTGLAGKRKRRAAEEIDDDGGDAQRSKILKKQLLVGRAELGELLDAFRSRN